VRKNSKVTTLRVWGNTCVFYITAAQNKNARVTILAFMIRDCENSMLQHACITGQSPPTYIL